MTLGPAIAIMPLLESASGHLAGVISIYGRVPFFYYVLHIPLVHALALLVSKLRFGYVNPRLFTNHPMKSATSSRIHLESLGVVSGLGRRYCHSVFPMPMVRLPQINAKRLVVKVPLAEPLAVAGARDVVPSSAGCGAACVHRTQLCRP